MGTHPIFESDFDCLTDVNNDWNETSMIHFLTLCTINLVLGGNASLLLYCRCGLNRYFKYQQKSVTDCSVIQYHHNVVGVVGNFTGIKIVNSTTCLIDLTLNPQGKCRKQIFSDHRRKGVMKPYETSYDNSVIKWSCVTHQDEPTPLQSECVSRRNQETTCCDTNNCNDSPSDYSNFEDQIIRQQIWEHTKHV